MKNFSYQKASCMTRFALISSPKAFHKSKDTQNGGGRSEEDATQSSQPSPKDVIDTPKIIELKGWKGDRKIYFSPDEPAELKLNITFLPVIL